MVETMIEDVEADVGLAERLRREGISEERRRSSLADFIYRIIGPKEGYRLRDCRDDGHTSQPPYE